MCALNLCWHTEIDIFGQLCYKLFIILYALFVNSRISHLADCYKVSFLLISPPCLCTHLAYFCFYLKVSFLTLYRIYNNDCITSLVVYVRMWHENNMTCPYLAIYFISSLFYMTLYSQHLTTVFLSFKILAIILTFTICESYKFILQSE